MTDASISRTSSTFLLPGRCRDDVYASCDSDGKNWNICVGGEPEDDKIFPAHLMATFTRADPDVTGSQHPPTETKYAISGHRIVPPSAVCSQGVPVTDNGYRPPSTIPIKLCVGDANRPSFIHAVHFLQNSREMQSHEYAPDRLEPGHTRMFHVGTAFSADMKTSPFDDPPSYESALSSEGVDHSEGSGDEGTTDNEPSVIERTWGSLVRSPWPASGGDF